MAQESTEPAVDMTTPLNTLRTLDELLHEMDGITPDELSNNKNRMRANAERSRQLLLAGHIAQRLQVQIMDEYYRYKGMDVTAPLA